MYNTESNNKMKRNEALCWQWFIIHVGMKMKKCFFFFFCISATDFFCVHDIPCYDVLPIMADIVPRKKKKTILHAGPSPSFFIDVMYISVTVAKKKLFKGHEL